MDERSERNARVGRPGYGVLLAVLAVAWLPAACGFDSRAPLEADVFPSLVIETAALPVAILAEPYSAAVHAVGGDGAYDWDVSAGALPPGLSLSVGELGSGDALVTGIPEEAGSFGFTLRVHSEDGQTAGQSYVLEVIPEPATVTIQNPVIPPALVGGPYSVLLRANNGAGLTDWLVVAGRLPAGVELTTGGRIHGTPTAEDTARFTVEVRRDGAMDRRDYVLAVVPHRPNRFDITIYPMQDIPEAVQPHLAAAVAEWEAAITADLPAVSMDETFFEAGSCGGFGRAANGTTVDDALILVNIVPIDGPGGVLGRAGPCAIRGASNLPFVGIITLDADDLLPLAGNETLTYIISHEIAHVLGFGTLWTHLGMVGGAGGSDPRFTGPSASQEYQALGGSGSVPLETEGGPGTAESHWRQSIFGNERMTGFSAPPGVAQPLSRVSIASIGDMGYTIDLGAADSFTLQAAFQAPAGADGHRWGQLGWDEVHLEPVRVLYPDGRTRTIEIR